MTGWPESECTLIVTYRPEGDPAQRWSFDPKQVISGEAEAIEKRSESTWDEFQKAILSGSIRARRVLLWHLLKKTHPPLRFDDVSFRAGEVEVEFEKHELQELRSEILKKDKLVSDEDRDKAIAAIDAQITELETRDIEQAQLDHENDAAGKAL